MKRLFSIVAFVAMLCVPFSFVSCGDDNDDVLNPPAPQSAYYKIYFDSGMTVTARSLVANFIAEKIGRDGEVNRTSDGAYSISISSIEKGDAIVKNLGKYETELTNLLKDNGVKYVEFTISRSNETLYKYHYNVADEVSFAGTYVYTDAEKDVWTLILTDESTDKTGYRVGSFTLPRDVDDVKAGTYVGTYSYKSSIISFSAEDSKVRVTAGFNLATEDGIPMTIVINSKTIATKVIFTVQK